MSAPMDPIKRDKIVTFGVVIVVAIIMIAMAAIVGLQSAGSMPQEDMLIISSILSGLMFVVIAIYMVYSYKTKPSLIEYKKLRDGESKNEEEEPIKENDSEEQS